MKNTKIKRVKREWKIRKWSEWKKNEKIRKLSEWKKNEKLRKECEWKENEKIRKTKNETGMKKYKNKECIKRKKN